MRINRFEEIVAWQRARVLVGEVYGVMASGPGCRDFSFRDQICKASVSVMTNIAEGFSRRSRLEFARFLDISRASAREVQSLLYVGRDLGYFDDQRFAKMFDLANVTAYLTGRLMSSLEQPPAKSTDAHN